MNEANVTNILLVGIGGQGVLTASEILAEAAIAAGHDVKKTEVAGMAQRGGVVTSHLRFGPKVLAPAIPPGKAHMLLAFEAAEGLRWLHHLAPGGVAVAGTHKVKPPVVSTGLFTYPDDPVAEMQASGADLVAIDAMGIATRLGNPRLVNTVMLGAASNWLPLEVEQVRAAVLKRFARKTDLIELNTRAFDEGRAAAAEVKAGRSAAA